VTRRRAIWLLSASSWTALALLCGLQIWISMIAHHHTLWRVLLYQILTWDVWILIGAAIAWLARRQPLVPVRLRAIATHAGAALAIAFVHSAWWALVLVKLRPYDVMNEDNFADAYWRLMPSGLAQQVALYCLVLAACLAADYYAKFREHERAAMRLEVSLAEARLHALDIQLRPHFLFNTLNSISALVRVERQSEATAMIAGLSELLRYSLEHSGNQQVPLASEVEITERYLEIERLRFADRMTYDLDIADDARTASVPTLLLQPLVENAVRHGIASSVARGSISVRAFRDDRWLRIEIFNNGTLATDRRDGVGLRNTHERLQHLYGDRHTLCLRGEPAGVRASIAIPWQP
jgi:two-component system, LytTR family, sensor kinase